MVSLIYEKVIVSSPGHVLAGKRLRKLGEFFSQKLKASETAKVGK